MTAWETEDEYAAAAAASLPTPTDTPYRTPSRNSRRSSRQKSASPAPSSSPPPLPSGDRRRGSRDVSNDESISILDPRRFTPTLHANLVSEILALRRDQEEKTKLIENLESDLHNARGEHEQFEDAIVLTAKENRSLKRQLQLLEGGTSSALSELARDRDEAVEGTADLKRRLETAQKKIRTQEDDSNRSHDLWLKDKDNWDEEKRKLERKVHVVESRLKTVLEEVATYQANHQHGNHHPESEAEETSRDPIHGHGSDTASVRTMSMTNSIRFSTLTGSTGYGGIKLNGVSLADELDLDDEEDQHTDHDGRESVMSARHNRTQSRESMFSRNHRRNQSTESLMRPGSVARGRLLANQAVLDRLEGGIMEDDESAPATIKVEYVDTGVQYSPPPSPKMQAVQTVSELEPLPINGTNGIEKLEKQAEIEAPVREWEIEANQRRKRVHAIPLVLDTPKASSMVSSASQTLEGPMSPPRTPISPTRAPPPPPVEIEIEPEVREMISISTQTDAPPEVKQTKRAPPPPPIPIPSIQLHPPKSAPPTPRESLLPQHSKDFGCQVSMPSAVPVRSISVQTEEIRVDKRINLLPPHLQPSAISSKPPSPEPTLEESKRFSPIPGNLPPRNPRRVKSRQSLELDIQSSPPTVSAATETHDAYPGNNDDGLLMKNQGSIRRPHRISSLFAGFDNISSDDAEDFADADMSDSEYKTALSAPKYANRNSKRMSSAPTSVPEHVELSEKSKPIPFQSLSRNTNSFDTTAEYGTAEVQPLPQKASMKSIVRQLDKPLTLITNSKPNPMRRAALIQSGVAAHQGRSRSPSLPEPTKEPPFPIPTRASSRKPPISISAPSDGNRSPTWGRGVGRAHYRSNSIRKSRSTTALPRGGGRAYRRQGSRSPPPMSASTEAPESPQLPPMPSNEITTPRYMKDTSSSRYKTHRAQPSVANTNNTAYTANTNASIEGGNQATSVVDAIAQTMAGEWMFKYVRRRKSFGVAENNTMDADAANGLRHKRWVWLAPYERAVMWSSKQPTSGSALMGKTGRKLVIQSVLDVKDENPPPKGQATLFNRSILILTPARALKFTATTPERHYIWLTALSFLAHSSQAVPEVVPAPLPLPQPTIPDFEIPRQPTRLRKNAIRDSIRVAKGKTTVARPGPTSVHSSRNGDFNLRDAEAFYSPTQDHHPENAASPPIVPRFTDRGGPLGGPPLTHGRKRSNTGSRIPPPLSFRGFSGPAVTLGGTTSSGGGGSSSYSHAPTNSTAGMSVGTTGSSDIYQSQHSSSVTGGNYNFSGRSSIRTSDASARPGHVVNNFFDAVGTVRMEAFISPMAMTRFEDFPDEQDEMNFVGGVNHHGHGNRRRSREHRRRRSRNRDSYYSGKSSRPSEDWYGAGGGGGGGGGSKTAGEEEYGGHFDQFASDPFRGF